MRRYQNRYNSAAPRDDQRYSSRRNPSRRVPIGRIENVLLQHDALRRRAIVYLKRCIQREWGWARGGVAGAIALWIKLNKMRWIDGCELRDGDADCVLGGLGLAESRDLRRRIEECFEDDRGGLRASDPYALGRGSGRRVGFRRGMSPAHRARGEGRRNVHTRGRTPVRARTAAHDPSRRPLKSALRVRSQFSGGRSVSTGPRRSRGRSRARFSEVGDSRSRRSDSECDATEVSRSNVSGSVLSQWTRSMTERSLKRHTRRNLKVSEIYTARQGAILNKKHALEAERLRAAREAAPPPYPGSDWQYTVLPNNYQPKYEYSTTPNNYQPQYGYGYPTKPTYYQPQHDYSRMPSNYGTKYEYSTRPNVSPPSYDERLKWGFYGPGQEDHLPLIDYQPGYNEQQMPKSDVPEVEVYELPAGDNSVHGRSLTPDHQPSNNDVAQWIEHSTAPSDRARQSVVDDIPEPMSAVCDIDEPGRAARYAVSFSIMSIEKGDRDTYIESLSVIQGIMSEVDDGEEDQRWKTAQLEAPEGRLLLGYRKPEGSFASEAWSERRK